MKRESPNLQSKDHELAVEHLQEKIQLKNEHDFCKLQLLDVTNAYNNLMTTYQG